jgi:E3 ubiquitin-protein ligase HERC3
MGPGEGGGAVGSPLVGGDSEASDTIEAFVSDTSLYCWGRADLGCLFLDLGVGSGQQIIGAPLRSKYSKKNVTSICTTLYHTVASTGTGETYGAGVNEDGQVQHERSEEQLSLPVLVEPLLSQRIIQVSCGENHTACLTSSGVVITFGCNEVGLESQFGALSNRM